MACTKTSKYMKTFTESKMGSCSEQLADTYTIDKMVYSREHDKNVTTS